MAKILKSPLDSFASHVDAMQAVRAIYLKHHLDKIRPFITPAVAKMVQDKATAAQAKVSNELPPEPVQEQPSQVTGTLRWVGQPS